MDKKLGLLGLSAILLLSSSTTVRAENFRDTGKLEKEAYLSKNSSNSNELLISDSLLAVLDSEAKDRVTSFQKPLETEISALGDVGEVGADAAQMVEDIEGLSTDFSTQAFDLWASSDPQASDSTAGDTETFIAQDTPAEDDPEAVESDEAEAAESTEDAEETSGFTFPGDISATATITTNYVFRGISQTDSNPAIQGSFDYSVGLIEDLDFYAGIWGSNIDFGDEADFGGESLGTLELDFYGGVTYALSEKASVGGSIVYYFYPGADESLDFNYIEFGLDAGYDFGPVATTLNFAYSPDFFGGSDDGFYVVGAAEVPLPYGLTASAGVGYQAISDNDTFGTPDYLEWNIGIGYAIAGFDLLLQYIDTDLSETECFGGTDLCSARVVFSASRTF